MQKSVVFANIYISRQPISKANEKFKVDESCNNYTEVTVNYRSTRSTPQPPSPHICTYAVLFQKFKQVIEKRRGNLCRNDVLKQKINNNLQSDVTQRGQRRLREASDSRVTRITGWLAILRTRYVRCQQLI